jgi:membrane-associated phospholipid phosphatase
MRRVLLYTLVLGLVVWLLAAPRGIEFDHGTVDRAHALDRGHPALHAAMAFGSAFGTNTTLLAGLLVPAAFGGEMMRSTVRAAVVALGATRIATATLKVTTNRRRPNGDRGGRKSSFPSGHASECAAVAQVVSRRHRRGGRLLWILVAWIAASRVFLDLHYPSDVLAGLLLGSVAAVLALRLQTLLGDTAAAAHAAPASASLKP